MTPRKLRRRLSNNKIDWNGARRQCFGAPELIYKKADTLFANQGGQNSKDRGKRSCGRLRSQRGVRRLTTFNTHSVWPLSAITSCPVIALADKRLRTKSAISLGVATLSSATLPASWCIFASFPSHHRASIIPGTIAKRTLLREIFHVSQLRGG
jgi:hypothetical protein